MTRRRGHTLIELLVVIALIVLLIGALIPSVKRSMQAARSTVCRSNLREIGRSLEMYRYDNHGWLPAVQLSDSASDLLPEETVWFLKLYPTYMSDPLVLRCPEDPFGYRMVRARDTMGDPSVGNYASYGINSFIMTSSDGFLANLDRHQPSRPLDTILAGDLGPDHSVSMGGESVAGGPRRNESLLSVDDGYDPFDSGAGFTGPWLTTRHGHGINMLTIGGGVREARTLELLQHPMAKRYRRCAAGGCTLCLELHLYHYSFAKDRLYWWTGLVPSE